MQEVSITKVENELTELAEFGALERLGKKISDHVVSWTVCHAHLAAFDIVCDEEIPNLQVSCPFTGGAKCIVLQQDRALIVLPNHVVMHG
eukprot:scaffold20045_cov69-Cylindrotheca_fusiformis.AAC.1